MQQVQRNRREKGRRRGLEVPLAVIRFGFLLAFVSVIIAVIPSALSSPVFIISPLASSIRFRFTDCFLFDPLRARILLRHQLLRVVTCFLVFRGWIIVVLIVILIIILFCLLILSDRSGDFSGEDLLLLLFILFIPSLVYALITRILLIIAVGITVDPLRNRPLGAFSSSFSFNAGRLERPLDVHQLPLAATGLAKGDRTDRLQHQLLLDGRRGGRTELDHHVDELGVRELADVDAHAQVVEVDGDHQAQRLRAGADANQPGAGRVLAAAVGEGRGGKVLRQRVRLVEQVGGNGAGGKVAHLDDHLGDAGGVELILKSGVGDLHVKERMLDQGAGAQKGTGLVAGVKGAQVRVAEDHAGEGGRHRRHRLVVQLTQAAA